MRKFMLLATVVALVVAALALPALASERGDNDRWWDNNNHYNNWWEDHYNNWWEDYYKNWWEDHYNDDNDNAAAAPVVTQESVQEAESGDVSQSFTVTGGGENSNQCAGIQGVANTGNAQNQISVVQNGSEADDFSFEDSGASITVSPSNTTLCDQEVNQAASAYYGGK